MTNEETHPPSKNEAAVSNETGPSGGKSQSPLIVKIYEEKGWKRTEIFEIIGIIIGLIVLWITFDTFKQTKRSVDISAHAMTESGKKDSIAEIRSEIENRPIIQIADLKIESLGNGNNTVVVFNIINMGKFPAIVLSGRYHLLSGGLMNVKEIENKELGKEELMNNAVSNTTIIPYAITNDPVPDSIYDRFKEGNIFLYLSGELKYVSLVPNRQYHYRFIYKLGNKPRFNVVGLKNDNSGIP